MTVIDCGSGRATQSQGFKTDGCEESEQDTDEYPSLVDNLGSGARCPDRSLNNFCFFPGWLNTCPLEERQVSTGDVHEDITMIANNTTHDTSTTTTTNTHRSTSSSTLVILVVITRITRIVALLVTGWSE